jgi:uncharacterized protein YbaR (Trm112 family)
LRAFATRTANIMDTRLFELLVCPVCKGPLRYVRESQQLVCQGDRLAYPVRDGIPVMLEAQAQPLPPEAASPAAGPAPVSGSA